MDKISNQMPVNYYPSQKTTPNESAHIGTPISPQTPNLVVPPEQRMERLTEVYGEKRLKQMGYIECATCSSRSYVDGSNDPGVSFKTPTNISPEASFSAVSSHEQEHVSNEKASAQAENREVISQSVKLFSSVCPECGRVYASGGLTTTVTASKPSSENQSQPYRGNSAEKKGNLVDARV